MDCQLHVKARNRLGEGIIWDPRAQALLWVDIPNRHVFRLARHDSNPLVIDMPEEPSSLALLDGGGALVTAGQSLYRVSFEDERIEKLTGVPGMEPQTDLNDGKSDRSGRFVFGSKDRHETKSNAAMFTFDGGNIRLLHEPLIVFNGPAFSRAGDRIYFADSPTCRILTARYDTANGALGEIDVFAEVPNGEGWPDGMTIDADDHLWNAHWDGGRLTRYRPDGSVERVIALPVKRPTSLSFGGPALTTIFISSAALDEPSGGSSDDAIDDGDVLRLDLGIAGLPETSVIVPSP